jgi:parallel beta-helix repeat protein
MLKFTDCVALMVAMMFTVTASAASLTVGAGGDYLTIQDAVDAASDDDVIHVLLGTYSENVTVDKSVTIRGDQGADVTRVTSPAGGTVFAVIASDVTITGLTIDGSSQFNSAGVLIGGRFPGDMEYLGVSDVTVSKCIIEDNLQGVYIWHASNCTIVNNTIRDNLDDGSQVMGCGIIIWDGNVDATVTNTPSQRNTIVNNEVYKNDRWGIFVGCWPATTDGTVTCDNSGTKIHGNNLYNNGDYRLLGGNYNWLGMGFSFTSGSKKASGNKILETAGGNDIWTYKVTELKAVGNPVTESLGPNIPMPTP